MAVVNIFDVLLSGDAGGNGISRFAVTNATETELLATEADSVTAALHAMYTSWASLLVNNYTIEISPLYKAVLASSGLIVANGSGTTTPTAIISATSGTHTAGVGARANWRTNTIKGRRFIRGATFITPLVSAAYATDGSVSPTTAGTLRVAATGYLTALNTATLLPVIWARPTSKTATDGEVGGVISVTVSLVAASLRSRRV